ncbi:OsmC family peroxiredoxin [Streptomyces armeniacus]|uniref:OsmC family peroxiredoxin n=1 Tax=Streptomyces armeniacus TaxID=83291 RepID=A0A345XZP1_9ACTN|nr:OsmC family protein [Streptomyces armeniacus]AXK37107.1 OsmC family peroxiredoxin [Streptomyces armeniacus]
MAATHTYELTVRWTGNTGTGTDSYRSFARTHEVRAEGKPSIPASADPYFRGDSDRWNPEELLVSALSECHMLWFLHLCAANGVVVTDYVDRPAGSMVMDEGGRGGGQFSEVLLRPQVTVADASMEEKAAALHADVPALCFIARSVNFPVRHEPTVRTERRGSPPPA